MRSSCDNRKRHGVGPRESSLNAVLVMGIPSSRGGKTISQAAAANGLDEVRMSRVRVVCAVRVHTTLGVGQLACSKIAVASTACRVHSRLVRVDGALRLVLFLNNLLRGPTKDHVPSASTSGGVRRLAGSGTGLRV